MLTFIGPASIPFCVPVFVVFLGVVGSIVIPITPASAMLTFIFAVFVFPLFVVALNVYSPFVNTSNTTPPSV